MHQEIFKEGCRREKRGYQDQKIPQLDAGVFHPDLDFFLHLHRVRVRRLAGQAGLESDGERPGAAAVLALGAGGDEVGHEVALEEAGELAILRQNDGGAGEGEDEQYYYYFVSGDALMDWWIEGLMCDD